MIKSMTGFGRAEASYNGTNVTAEIRTLNSRYLDISIRLPAVLQDREHLVRDLIQNHLTRGKISLTVNLENAPDDGESMRLDLAGVDRVHAMLNDIRRRAGIDAPLQVGDLLRFDQIFERRPPDPERVEAIWTVAQKALLQALQETDAMRLREGTQLASSFKSQIADISERLETVKALAAERAPEARRRMIDRLAGFKDDIHVEKERIEQEIALLADRMDINEEIVRLGSHLKFVLDALDADEPVGRRLNFLTQELNRELNTIGSKSYHSEIAHQVVMCKERVEQIREQVQNIE